MDDPWGSPWTTSISDKDHANPRSKAVLEPPPRAFLSATPSPRLPAVASPSPWTDDGDGFGDFEAPETNGSGYAGWGGWSGSDANSNANRNPSPRSLSPTKEHHHDRSGPIAWPESIAGFSSTSHGVGVRQLSPSLDPWASEVSLNPPSDGGSRTPRLVLESPAVNATHGGKAGIAEDVDLAKETPLGTPASGLGGEIAAGGLVVLPQPPEGRPRLESRDPATDDGVQDELNVSSPEKKEVQTSVQSEESGPPSLSDDDSELDIQRQDSPITSVDEDSKTRTRAPRKVSGKVQVLVEKFDGLAKSAVEEPPPPIPRQRSATRSGSDKSTTEDEGDFGDFEEADEVQTDTVGRPATPVTQEQIERGTQRATQQPLSPRSPQALRPFAVDLEALLSKYGPIEFKVDLEPVDKLFDTHKLGSLEPVGHTDAFISDRVIADSFAGISERKAWYRVSRLGSSRQHDAGDIDNYRRVAWATSTVRLDTITTVRRWMEEDSLTGRPTLGGGTGRGNMFGWGSEAEPVELSEVFGRKAERTPAHSRTASLQQAPVSPPHQRKVSGSVGSPIQHRPPGSISTPVASFGWSSGPSADPIPMEPESLTQLLPKATKPTSSVIPPPPRKTSSPAGATPVQGSIAKALPPPPPLQLPKQLPIKEEVGEEDEDEWGEMVSSPTDLGHGIGGRQGLNAVVTSAEVIPPASPPHHRQRTISVDEHSPFNLPQDAWSAEPALEPQAKVEPPKRINVALTQPHPTHPFSPLTPASITSPGLSSESASMPSPFKMLMPPVGASWTPASDHPFTPTTPLAIASPVPVLASSAAPSPEKQESSALTTAAASIIAGLPDLSYMLR